MCAMKRNVTQPNGRENADDARDTLLPHSPRAKPVSTVLHDRSYCLPHHRKLSTDIHLHLLSSCTERINVSSLPRSLFRTQLPPSTQNSMFPPEETKSTQNANATRVPPLCLPMITTHEVCYVRHITLSDQVNEEIFYKSKPTC